MDTIIIITDTPPATCELCGQQKELRPYGPNGENICFPCGQKDVAGTVQKFYRRIGVEMGKEEVRALLVRSGEIKQ